MIIRPMEPEDADSVAQIEKDSFTQPWSRQGFLDAMRLPENIMLVAQEDGEILGYQCTYVSFDEGELTNIAVKNQHEEKVWVRILSDACRKRQKSQVLSALCSKPG